MKEGKEERGGEEDGRKGEEKVWEAESNEVPRVKFF